MKVVHAWGTCLSCSQLTSFRVYQFLAEPPICRFYIYVHAKLWYTILIIFPSSTNLMTDANSSPTWCKLPKNPFCRVCFKALCMLAISKSSVEHWKDLLVDSTGPKWENQKKMVLKRFENMNLIAGLVLTSSAVLISTNFQTDKPFRSFVLEVSSFVAALFSLLTGLCVLVIYEPCFAQKSILESLKDSRSRLICCLILMAFPSLALVVSTLALLAAVFIVGFTCNEPFGIALIIGTCAIMLLITVLAVYVFNSPMHKLSAAHDSDNVTHGPSGQRSAIP